MTTINRLIGQSYRIEGHAGSGGMGVVYRARDLQSGKVVAVKEMRYLGLDRDKELLARFQREARLLADIRHPRVVSYVDHGFGEDGCPYLVTEWLEGETLSPLLKRRGKLEVAEVIDLGVAVCEGLAAVHERGCVHRDLKPGNIFLVESRADDARLIDFGLAVAEYATRLTDPDAVFGTPAYIAPEMAQLDSGAQGNAADLYALGVILFQCLTGRRPFEADSPAALLAKAALQTPPRVSSLVSEVPDGLDELIFTLLDRDPLERPESASAVSARLQTVSRGSSHSSSDARDASGASLSGEEQRARSVLVVDQIRHLSSEDETVQVDRRGVDVELFSLLSRHSTRCVPIKGGCYISVIGEQDGVEAPLVAARCALALHRRFPHSRAAIATGYAADSQTLPSGKPIERAFEALDSAGIGEIRLDESTVSILGRRFEILDGYLLGELLPAQQTRVRGVEVPFVGRDRELANLLGLLESALDQERLETGLVIAPPGVGKSRLRAELLGAAGELRAWGRFWTIEGDPVALDQPLRGARAMLAAALDVKETDDDSEQRERLDAYLRDLVGPRASELSPPLEQILGLGDGLLPSDLEGSREELRAAWVSWLRAELERTPLFLVIDDLQWLDRPTVQLLTESARTLTDCSWALLAFSRPEGWTRYPDFCQQAVREVIRLAPLAKRACRTMIASVVGDAGEEFVNRLVNACEGNPFFLEELLRASPEDDTLHCIPDSVLAMVAHRIERLEKTARDLLRAGSVFGQAFWPEACIPLVNGDVANALTELKQEELIFYRHESKVAGQPEYQFRHQLMQSAAYAGLSEPDREKAHLVAAHWLDAHEFDAAAVARHYRLGCDTGKAAPLYTKAAFAALAADDLDIAVSHSEEAERCNATGELLGRAYLARAQALNWLGRHEQACGHALLAEQLIPRAQPEWGAAVRHGIWSHFDTSRSEKVVELAQSLLEFLRTGDAQDAHLLAACNAFACTGALDKENLTAALQKEVERRRPLPARVARLHSFYVGMVHGIQGRYDLATQRLTETLRLLEDNDDNRLRRLCVTNLVDFFVDAGQYERAEALACDALTSEADSYTTSGLLLALVRCHLRRGQIPQAMARLSEVERSLAGQAPFSLARAQTALAAGDFDTAKAVAREQLEPDYSGRYQGFLLAVLARARSATGDDEGARAAIRQALELVERGDTHCEGEYWIRLTHVELIERSGDSAAAKRLGREVADDLLARAARIANPEMRASFLENIEEHAEILRRASERTT